MITNKSVTYQSLILLGSFTFFVDNVRNLEHFTPFIICLSLYVIFLKMNFSSIHILNLKRYSYWFLAINSQLDIFIYLLILMLFISSCISVLLSDVFFHLLKEQPLGFPLNQIC